MILILINFNFIESQWKFWYECQWNFSMPSNLMHVFFMGSNCNLISFLLFLINISQYFLDQSYVVFRLKLGTSLCRCFEYLTACIVIALCRKNTKGVSYFFLIACGGERFYLLLGCTHCLQRKRRLAAVWRKMNGRRSKNAKNGKSTSRAGVWILLLLTEPQSGGL